MNPLDLTIPFKLLLSLQKKQEFSFFIKYINERVNEVYINIANAHFNSATQALESASYSSSSDIELRDAISHLRDAYNIYDADISKTLNKKVLLFFNETEDIYKLHQKAEIRLIQTLIAKLIALLYMEMNEIHNAVRWKSEALSKFNYYIEIYRGKKFKDYKHNSHLFQFPLELSTFTPEEPHLKLFKSLNHNYITLEIEKNVSAGAGGFNLGYYYHYEISQEAYKYLQDQRRNFEHSFSF